MAPDTPASEHRRMTPAACTRATPGCERAPSVAEHAGAPPPNAGTRARRRLPLTLALGVLVTVAAAGCFATLPSRGGGQARFTPPRTVRAADVAVPPGFTIVAVATGLTFPSGVAFDDGGGVYVSETGYAYGEQWTTPRVLRVDAGGRTTVVASGGRNGPWNGLAFADRALFVAEGGVLEGGRVLRIDPANGRIRVLADGLPSRGDHHTNGPVVGADGFVYFGQGTATNAGIVGDDNAEFGWLTRFPEVHDVPCADVTLRGVNAASTRGSTGAFSPVGAATRPGQVVRGALPCNGAVLRVPASGGPLALVAWGFRNPYGLAFAPDGRLFVTDNGYDDRGSRPVHGAADLLWAVEPGRWYGWPDFSGARALDDGDHFVPPGKPRPAPLLASHPGVPPKPAAALPVHASANGLDFSRAPSFGWVGQAFVAELGDQAPVVGKVTGPVGFKVVRVDVATGVIEDFAVNRGASNGPASQLRSGGLERPIAARFDPTGAALYVVDFGVLSMSSAGTTPHPGTGVLWRITRAAAGGGAR
jgi:glucose/arabinose dehydrogenase